LFWILAGVGDVLLELPHVADGVGVEQQLSVRQVILVFKDTLHARPLVHGSQDVVEELVDHIGRLVPQDSIDNPEVRLRLVRVPLQEVVVHLQLIGILASLVGNELGVLLEDIADDEEELVNAERDSHLVCWGVRGSGWDRLNPFSKNGHGGYRNSACLSKQCVSTE
jgi:hypothetical protein